jgi:hypothetical protein
MSVPCSGLLSGQSNVEANSDRGNFEPSCAVAEYFIPNLSYYAHCVFTCLAVLVLYKV